MKRHRRERIRKKKNLMSLTLKRMKFLRKKKKHIKKLKKWRLFVKSRKTKDGREKQKIMRLLKQSRPKSKKRWIWI